MGDLKPKTEISKEKSGWSKPELYILDFRQTSSGFITDPEAEDGVYSATQAGS